MILMEDKLKEMQKELDELYAKEGLTDERDRFIRT